MNTSFTDSLTQNNKSAENTSNTEWRARLAYKCGICGKEYDSIKARTECELACLKKQEEEKRLAAAKKNRKSKWLVKKK